MHKMCAFKVFLITLIVSVSTELHHNSDKNSDPSAIINSFCNRDAEKIAVDVIVFDSNNNNNQQDSLLQHGIHDDKSLNKNKRHASGRNDYKDRPRPNQRSLVIIFDGTASMHDDLKQLTDGAQKIVNELSMRDDNPIFNYVLVVFRDPSIDPPFNTKNPDELLKKLKDIKIFGGGDCPELALSGLKIGLKFALPNSFIYVFTDATTRDYSYYLETLGMIQNKQTVVNFLLTGDCNERDEPSYQVYEQIARSSNGQVYDMQKNDIKEVLMAIRHSINDNYAALKNVDNENAGTSETQLNVDKTISELSVSVAGKNPRLTITDPKNKTTIGDTELTLENLKIVKIKDPIAGKWNVEAEANSSHSIRLGAISEMKFKFGFSLETPAKISETSYQPLVGHTNVLSIFISDPSLVNVLNNITIILVPTNPSEVSLKFTIPLIKTQDDVYSTKPFDIPRQMFKIQLNGVDAASNDIERLISTSIQSTKGSAPEVTVEANQLEIPEYENLILKCTVKSLVPINVRWHHEDRIIKEVNSNQSNDLEIRIEHVEKSDAGKYMCRARNDVDSEEKEIIIKIVLAPKLTLIPDSLVVVENSMVSFRCFMENVEDPVWVWLNKKGEVLQNGGETLNLLMNRTNNGEEVVCRSMNDVEIESRASVVVEYPPQFIVTFKHNDTRIKMQMEHGKSFWLNCETDANPAGEIKWFYYSLGDVNLEQKIPLKELSGNSSAFFQIMNQTTEGLYECRVRNQMGQVSRIFSIEDYPQSSPRIITESDVMFVDETDDVELICGCEDCIPVQNYSWNNSKISFENKPNDNVENFFVEKQEDERSFQYFLRIENVSEKDNGTYECFLANHLGGEKKVIQLVVRTMPKIGRIVVQIGNDPEWNVVEDEEISIQENQKISLNCQVNGFPAPGVIWNQGDAENNQTFENPFVIKRVQEAHMGFYQCDAQNSVGLTSKKVMLDVKIPPKVLNPQNNVHKVIEGNEVELKCDIKGRPDPIISWYAHSKPIVKSLKFKMFDDNSILKFNPLLNDSGVYSCLGVNDFGKISENFTVVVHGLPQILPSNDEFVKVKSGENITLKCDVTGFPQARIYWTLESHKILEDDSHLQMLDCGVRNSGVYICNAQNDIGIAQKVYYVTVTEPPRIITHFENITLFTNQTKDLTCEAVGTPEPEIMWMLEQEVIARGHGVTLTSTMQSGTYSCKAENAEGIISSDFQLIIINEPSRIESFEYIDPKMEVQENSELELVCPYENFNEISWKHNEQSLSNTFLMSNKFKIESIKRGSSGNWSCTVGNTAGNASFYYHVNVLSKPKMISDRDLSNRITDFISEEMEVNEKSFKIGDTLVLNCSADGYPKPKIYWKKSSDIIAETDVLEIENLQLHHRDIYTCIAENNQGIQKKIFKVEVLSPPIIDDGNVQKHFHLGLGESVAMKCKMFAHPIPTIFWFKDNVLLEDEAEEFLEIKNVSLADDGTYKCIGKNSMGTEKIEYFISILEPANLLLMKGDVINEESWTLSCVAKGNPLPVVSWINNGKILSSTSRLKVEKMLSNHDSATVYFNGYGNGISYLDPFNISSSKEKFHSQLSMISKNTLKLDLVFKKKDHSVTGKYNCMTYNAIGRDEKTMEILFKEKPFYNEKQMEKLKETEVLEGLPLLLACLINGQPQPKITWFKDQVQLSDNETIKLLNNNRFLNIIETSLFDQGVYTCQAINDVGDMKFDYNVNILAPPRFVEYSVAAPLERDRYHNDKAKVIEEKKDPQNVIRVMEGDNLDLDCNVKGSPTPIVYWIKVNYYDESKNEILEENENILKLKSINESLTFMCFANNTIGLAKKIYHVELQFPPRLVDDLRKDIKHVVELHHGVNLECKINGAPEATITWFYNSSEISSANGEVYFSSDRQVMRIINTGKANQGKYICIGENNHGKVERIFYVRVSVPIQWSLFSPWSACSTTCGTGGTQYRTRICLLSNGSPARGDDYKCIGENVEIRKCHLFPCPVNGGWSKWTRWTECPGKCIEDKSKEALTQRRYRKCDSPPASHGGIECSGESAEEMECQVEYCPVHGGWGSWSLWSNCSKTCGLSHRMRKRLCNKPTPRNNGVFCKGENVEYEQCDLPRCSNNRNLVKTFDFDNEEDTSESSNEKYREMAELEIKNEQEMPRSFQFSNHREVEFIPHHDNVQNGVKIPRIKVTMDTYKPISAETYHQHIALNRNHNLDAEDILEFEDEDSTEKYNDVEFESPENEEDYKKKKTCREGFSFNQINDQCEDINECNIRNRCRLGERCVNTLGGYRCDQVVKDEIKRSAKMLAFKEDCPEGFHQDGGHCVDSDECFLMSHDCDENQKCFNTKGSYFCIPITCPEFYEVDLKQSKCIQVCSKHPCNSKDKLIAKSIQYIFISKSLDNITDTQSVAKLINYDLKSLPLTNSNFKLAQNHHNKAFHLENNQQKPSIGYLHANKILLNVEQVYKLRITAESSNNNNTIIYINHFTVYFYSY